MVVIQTTGAGTAFASTLKCVAINGTVILTPKLLVISLALQTLQTSWRASSLTARATAPTLSAYGEKVAGP